MKSRLWFVLITSLVIPSICNAQGVPTADVPGTMQAASETTETVKGSTETVEQVKTGQKTMAKMGAAKKSVSDFINKQRDVIQKKMEKIEKYKEKIEKAKETMEAYKDQTEQYINDAKDKVNDAKSKVEGAVNTAKEYKDKAENAIETAKGYAEQAKDVAETAKGAAEAAKAKVAGTIDAAKEKAGISDNVESPEINDNVTMPESDISATTNKLVETTTAQPTRQKIGGGVSTSASSAAAGTVGRASTSAAILSGGSASLSNQVASPSSISSVADSTIAKSASLSTVKAPVSKAVEGENVIVSSDGNIVNIKKEPTNSKDIVATKGAIKAPQDSDDKISEISGKQAVLDSAINNKDIEAAKVTSPTTKEKNQLRDAQATEKVPQIEKNKNSTIKKPTRKTFQTSFNQSTIHNSYPLAFASAMSVDTVGNETMDGTLIVPMSIYLLCDGLNYEKASEEGKYADCLQKAINIGQRDNKEDAGGKKESQDVNRDIQNASVDYTVASYFDAMNIYNESLTFKNNKLDPVLNSQTADVDGSWRIAKEMHMVLGTRLNILRKLWTRELGVVAFSAFIARDKQD
ncbi:MAG: hypothetical protein E7020_06580 [Alphaproteobacteria bacterium]|nr:hypothetical protein [Alphaproteobacteria bacterium]